jgi:SAM-dependent methyltransferase
MQFRIIVKGMPFLRLLRGLPAYLKAYGELRRQAGPAPQPFPFGPLYPCLEDWHQQSGIAGGHYFHQDLLVAGRIFVNRPQRHCDVGSRIDGLVAHVASFRPIEVLDIRELASAHPNILFRRADLMDPAFPLRDECDSLSCLHVLEHFGLGRYGDRLDYRGHLRGWENLHRMLKPGGKLYFSVPIGAQRIEFNAHRVFSLAYLLDELIRDRYRLDAFSYVDDAGDLYREAPLTPDAVRRNFGCRYGCGIFELTKA